MEKIGIFYTTGTKTTVGVVDEIDFYLKRDEHYIFDIKNGIDELKNFNNLILVSPTYGVGELHPFWKKYLNEIEKIDFSGKVVGLVGLGNQLAFGESFCGGIRFLYDAITKNGGKIVGYTSTEGYHYEETTIVEDDKFIGLALDETNQAKLTPKRIEAWVNDIKKEFK